MISSDDELTWIQWFCNLQGNEFFIQVDEDYIQDRFNLTNLNEIVPNFKRAYDEILDFASPSTSNEGSESAERDSEDRFMKRRQNATQLYGLLHARFILTQQGLAMMLDKYQKAEFGACPRMLCEEQRVLPIGLSDTLGDNTVKLYCIRCREVYHTKHVSIGGVHDIRHANIDGAFFGTSFPHMFFMTYPFLIPQEPKNKFIPRMYGFKLHPKAISGAQSQSSDSIA